MPKISHSVDTAAGVDATADTRPADSVTRTAAAPTRPSSRSGPEAWVPASSSAVVNADTAAPGTGSAGESAIGESVQDRVWGALRGHPGATPAELATEARVGRSTVSKLLATWSAEGSATSVAGDTARGARRWTATPSFAPTAPPPDPGRGSGTEAPVADAVIDGADADHRADEPVTALGLGVDTDTDIADIDDADGAESHGAAAGAHGAFVAGDGPGAVEPSAPADADPPPARPAAGRGPGRNCSGSQRLGAGGLRGMVEDFLTENPVEHGPVEIGKALRRSSGAVANALERLVETGGTERTNDRPKRYRYADAEARPNLADRADEGGDVPAQGGRGRAGER